MAQPEFKRFVVFAEMRTGSNLLEATLNAIKRVTCFGEAFNPYMMGWPDKDELKGITRDEREADPMRLLNAIWDKPNHLPGFRYFHDHDPRVFDAIMDDHACAKIILTRNPVDSFVSTVLARETNQWKLNETETPIPAAIRFDVDEFRQNISEIEEFQLRVLNRLQTTGQTGFWLGYEDLRDAEVMTGLLHWMGRTDLERVAPANDQVPQNPRELSDKVVNFDEMSDALAELDPFMLRRIPNFEPRRGPNVPTFHGCNAGRGLLFMPVRGGPTETVLSTLKAAGKLEGSFTQNSLRQWKRTRPGHRSFTVLRHPLLRAYAAFEALLDGGNTELRQLMREIHRVNLPDEDAIAAMPEDKRAACFAQFLDFLRRSLNAQTTLAVHPGWASQSEVLAGFARFASPDMVIHEDDLAEDLGWIAARAGISHLPEPQKRQFPAFLDDPALRKAARAAYLRDYIAFGFE